jgi:protein-disulfide isomerase-like protein with CxxC motif
MARLLAQYFTDPLCSWSWGNEPYYRKLRAAFGEQIQWRHRLGGLMERWAPTFYDPLYNLRGGDAEALARHQEEVSLLTQMPIDVAFWSEHPPASTHPICIAVKAAGLQGAEIEDQYLRRVREALLTEKRRLDGTAAFVALAHDIPAMSVRDFRSNLTSKQAQEAFREDWAMARSPAPGARDTKEVEGHVRYSFPTILLHNTAGKYRVLDADHSYDECIRAVQELDPRATRRPPPAIEQFAVEYPRFATKEVVVVCEMAWDDAEEWLTRRVQEGALRKRPVGHFCMWETPEEAAP